MTTANFSEPTRANFNSSIGATAPTTGRGVLHIDRSDLLRFRWGAIAGGVVTALGLWILLYALGVAIGLATIDIDRNGQVSGSAAFSGVWGMVAPLVALFVGGLVAARTSGPATRLKGLLQGAVVWSLTAVLGIVVVGGVAQGIAGAAGTTAEALAPMAAKFDINGSNALAPVNDRLTQAGAPRITADQLDIVTRDVVSDAVRTGTVDNASLVRALTAETTMSRPEAELVAARVESQWKQFVEQAKVEAVKAAETTSKAFFALFIALALGLLAAIGGGLLGVTRGQRDHAEDIDVMTRDVASRPRVVLP